MATSLWRGTSWRTLNYTHPILSIGCFRMTICTLPHLRAAPSVAVLARCTSPWRACLAWSRGCHPMLRENRISRSARNPLNKWELEFRACGLRPQSREQGGENNGPERAERGWSRRRDTNPESAGLLPDARKHAAIGKKIPTGELVGIFKWWASGRRVSPIPTEAKSIMELAPSRRLRVRPA